MKGLLNPSQHRAVTVTLRGFENSLRQALGWLDGRRENGILYRGTLSLSAKNREMMRLEIAAALDEIAALSRTFALDREEEDARGLIRSEMSVAWANLLDTQSKKLRGYGDVDPRLAEILDPSIIRLSNIAIGLENLLDDAPASGENHDKH